MGFALNAVFLPYAGVYHDARLYAGQVVQAGIGRLSDDLFFRYGSQSRYTVLPDVLAVPAAWVGVEWVFFAAYMSANILRLWATQRLTLRLLGPTPAAAAGLLLAAAAPGWWAKYGVFAVNEWYFTARVPGVALSVLGLERALAGRWLTAGGLFLIAGAIHPLMAAPAVAVAGGAWTLGWARTPGRWAVVAGPVVALAGVGVYVTVAAGVMDPVWAGRVLNAGSPIDPRVWEIGDLVRVTVASACTVAVAAATRPAGRWLLAVAAAAALVGVVSGVAAAVGRWVLPLQLQPVRLGWPLELLRLPVGLTVVAGLWAKGTDGRAAAVALFAALTAGGDLLRPAAAQVFLVTAVVGIAAARWAWRPADGGWLWRGLVLALGLWAVAWYALVVPWEIWSQTADGGLGWLTFGERLEVVGQPFGPLARLAGGLLAMAAVGRLVRRPGPRTAVALGVGLTAAVAAFVVPRSDWVAARTDRRHADVRFVAAYLAERPAGGHPPAVYWPGLPLEQAWVGFETPSYFNVWQLSGAMFFRGTAVEGNRRLAVVRPFELHRIRREFGSHPELSGEAIDADAEAGQPDLAAFRTLVADPAVDVVVLTHDYGGAAATNGSVWVYEARKR